jgi:hypothetical protein
MRGDGGLERRYRRLLALYPAAHRSAHEQEMLGVLMTGARAGQRLPGLAESADLIWGAVRIRLRPGRHGAGDPGWGDALAVVSVVLPVFSLVYSASATLATLGVAVLAPSVFTGQFLARAALAALVLLRLRRTAALAAGGFLIWFTVSAAGAPNWSYLEPEVVVVICWLALETVALLASPGPRRGLQIMTWKHHALVIAVAAAGGGTWKAPQMRVAIMITLAVIAVVAMALASPLSRRIMALLSIPLYYWAVGAVVPPSLVIGPGIAAAGWDGPLRVTLTCLPVMALLSLAVAALLRSAQHPRRPPAR